MGKRGKRGRDDSANIVAIDGAATEAGTVARSGGQSSTVARSDGQSSTGAAEGCGHISVKGGGSKTAAGEVCEQCQTNKKDARQRARSIRGDSMSSEASTSSKKSKKSTVQRVTRTSSEIMMSGPAVSNLQLIAHDAAHALQIRGFESPYLPKTKKKGKKK